MTVKTLLSGMVIWMRHMSTYDKSQCLLVLSTWFTPLTKDFCPYQMTWEISFQASRFVAQANVLVIINIIIRDD